MAKRKHHQTHHRSHEDEPEEAEQEQVEEAEAEPATTQEDAPGYAPEQPAEGGTPLSHHDIKEGLGSGEKQNGDE